MFWSKTKTDDVESKIDILIGLKHGSDSSSFKDFAKMLYELGDGRYVISIDPKNLGKVFVQEEVLFVSKKVPHAKSN